MQINGFEGKAFALLVFGVPQKIVLETQDCRCVGDYDFLGFERGLDPLIRVTVHVLYYCLSLM